LEVRRAGADKWEWEYMRSVYAVWQAARQTVGTFARRIACVQIGSQVVASRSRGWSPKDKREGE